MAYYLDLFSPDTYDHFSNSTRNVSGFRISQKTSAEKIKAGDKLICYITKLGRWAGILEVLDGPFIDQTPLFDDTDDPFVLRFHVKPLVWLEKDRSIPIRNDIVWNQLSFTKVHLKTSSSWTGKLRSSLSKIDPEDGKILEDLLSKQNIERVVYSISEEDSTKARQLRIKLPNREVNATVPQNDLDEEQENAISSLPQIRESLKIQALLAHIGVQMNMKIWIPKSDRGAVLTEWKTNHQNLLDTLPLNYDEITLRTIEQIDVLWLKGRAIVRAFEVEHTTSIYSGILRMADLVALQPNMDIKLHIVAPYSRKEKVFQEIRRPIFSVLEKGPLSKICTYLSYDSIREISNLKHLSYLSDSVLDEYVEHEE